MFTIYTVTFNPALDKTARLDCLHIGGLNRLGDVSLDPGGKGINTARTLQSMGETAKVLGFAAGRSGKILQEMLEEENIETDFLWIEGETRTNLKLIGHYGELTEINEAGPIVSNDCIQKFIENLMSIVLPGDVVVLSGNPGSSVCKDIYSQIVDRLSEKQVETIVDADGPYLASVLDSVNLPYAVKPNLHELLEYYGEDETGEWSLDRIAELCKRLIRKGIKLAAVSLGEKGALFANDSHILYAPGLPIQVNSVVGAGDAMTAALARSAAHHSTLEETALLGMCAASAACMTEGTCPPSSETMKRLAGTVKWTEL